LDRRATVAMSMLRSPRHSGCALLLLALAGCLPVAFNQLQTGPRTPRRHELPRLQPEEGGLRKTTTPNFENRSSTPFFAWAASALMAVALLAAPFQSAWAEENLAKVAPCLLSKCQLPLAKCILNPSCAADLTCVIACSGQPDESSCQINCGNNFENDVVVEFNKCALSAKKCVPQRPDKGLVPGDKKWDPVKGRYPVPPPESVSDDFEVSKMTGRWYITAGLNPLFDTFDCQVHFFEGMAPTEKSPGRLVGKINWRINEVDGEFISRSTVQSFVQAQPGLLLNHGNEYLHYQDDWYVLDHGFEDDPEKGFVLIYYRGQNDAWAGYGGGTLYTRSKTIPPEIMDRVREATGKAKVPYDRYWKETDNTCAAEGDPAKLRTIYAEKLLEQAEMGFEEQLTLLARSTISKVDQEEKLIMDAANRLEKKTEKFVREEINASEQAIEDSELAFEAPLRKLKEFFKPRR